MYNLIRVAVGVVFNPAGQILVALRPADKVQGGLWEFPGGKIENNETAEQALIRELLEEVDITVTLAQPFISCEHRYQHHHLGLEAFLVREFTGSAYGKEGQAIDWVTPSSLRELPLLAGNYPILEALLALQ